MCNCLQDETWITSRPGRDGCSAREGGDGARRTGAEAGLCHPANSLRCRQADRRAAGVQDLTMLAIWARSSLVGGVKNSQPWSGSWRCLGWSAGGSGGSGGPGGGASRASGGTHERSGSEGAWPRPSSVLTWL